MNPYIGHPSQLLGAEEHRLVGGKGDGMRLFQLRNGRGLELTVAADRCADVYRLSYKGVNMGFFSPCGYVAPAYYEREGNNFLKSFTAGFCTTCGLNNVGGEAMDGDEHLPAHGTIGHTPAESVYTTVDEEAVSLFATVDSATLFGSKLLLRRRITCPLGEDAFVVEDTVSNEGDQVTPLMLMYHINLGYPLLDENAQLTVNSVDVCPRTEHAAKDLATWDQMLPPQPGFREQVYFHTFAGEEGRAQLYNPTLNMGLTISFPTAVMPFLTQWKMMGVRDYVLGLEPGNVTPEGRQIMRDKGCLQLLQPGETATLRYRVELFEK